MRLIDADALKEALTEIFDIVEVVTFDDIIEKIDNAPTMPLPDFKEGYKQAILDGKTNYSRPQGEWIPLTLYNGFTYWECSECGEKNIFALTKFCFHCGAKMMKGEVEI